MLDSKVLNCEYGKDKKESFKKKKREEKSSKLVGKRFVKGFHLTRSSVYFIL